MTRAGRLLICGVGLIGGSVAAGLRAHFPEAIIGVDADPDALAAAQRAGLIDAIGWPADRGAAGSGAAGSGAAGSGAAGSGAAGSGAAALGPADTVLIAVPTLSVPAVLESLWDAERGLLAGGAVVTDVASVKQPVIDAALSICGRLPANLVPGHPIAGSERSGVGAARPDLFRDHRVILTPAEQTAAAAIERVREIWEALGAEVCFMPVAEHDRVLAMTSHLPHLLAFALVDTLGRVPEHEAVFRFAAGGFRDFTRIASSDPVMWSDIFTANATAVSRVLDALEAELGELRALLDAGDREGLRAIFTRAKALRDTHVAGTGASSHD